MLPCFALKQANSQKAVLALKKNMMVSEDYCLAPELSILPDQLAGAAEIPLRGIMTSSIVSALILSLLSKTIQCPQCLQMLLQLPFIQNNTPVGRQEWTIGNVTAHLDWKVGRNAGESIPICGHSPQHLPRVLGQGDLWSHSLMPSLLCGPLRAGITPFICMYLILLKIVSQFSMWVFPTQKCSFLHLMQIGLSNLKYQQLPFCMK